MPSSIDPLMSSAVAPLAAFASSAVVGERALTTPLTHEDMHAAGVSLGSAGFSCIDDAADTFALAHGVSRFLSVESCGQYWIVTIGDRVHVFDRFGDPTEEVTGVDLHTKIIALTGSAL